MSAIVEEIARLVLWVVVDVILVGTGELVRFIASFGKHRPRWDLYTRDSPVRFVLLSELSFWIGAAFWIVVIALAYRILSGA